MSKQSSDKSKTNSKSSSQGKRISRLRRNFSRSSGVSISKYRAEILKLKCKINRTKGKLKSILEKKRIEFRSLKKINNLKSNKEKTIE